jgi:hypothetical protein
MINTVTPFATHTPQPTAQTKYPTLSPTEFANLYIQPLGTPYPELSSETSSQIQVYPYGLGLYPNVGSTKLFELEKNRYKFDNFFKLEFSLPENWSIQGSEHIFNPASQRETYLFYRNPIIGDNKQEIESTLVFITYPILTTADTTAELFHSFCSEFILCDSEQLLPSNFITSPSSVGYKCEYTNESTKYTKYTVYENNFLYSMSFPSSALPRLEKEFLFFVQNITYEKQ